MNLQEVKRVLSQLNVKPNKAKGQNFLIDDKIANKIIQTSKITKEQTILEIGPGLGALTEKLLEVAKFVVCIEIEETFCSYLSKKFDHHNNLKIINADSLKIVIPQHDKLVSNIPYKITGPLLEKFFFRNEFAPGTITIEKKIAERILNISEYKNTSRIGINTNTFTNPTYICDISPHGFYPVPNIALSLIHLEPKGNLDFFLKDVSTKRFFLEFIAGIMPYKNKNIANAIELFFKNRAPKNTKKVNKEEIQTVLKDSNFDNKKVFYYKHSELLHICKTIHDYINW